MFIGVEFANEDGIALVHLSWFTPLKKQVYWPPYKSQVLFEKALVNPEYPNEKWKLYGVKSILFETDNHSKAKNKIKLAETLSDVGTDAESSEVKRRKRAAPRRLSYSSEDEESNLPRPPKIKLTAAESYTQTLLTPSYNENPNSPSTLSTYSTSNLNTSQLQIYHTELMGKLTLICEQNKQILHQLQKKEPTSVEHIIPELPATLPLMTLEDLDQIEDYLKEKAHQKIMVLHFSTFGGRDLTGIVNGILKRALKNKLASEFNFFGKGTKKPFNKLTLNQVILAAVLKQVPTETEKSVEGAIKVWLKHAPQRQKLEEDKKPNF